MVTIPSDAVLAAPDDDRLPIDTGTGARSRLDSAAQ
jgi:hypothetical protein